MPKNRNKKFKMDIEYRLFRIKHLADKYKWKIFNEENGILEYVGMHNWEGMRNCAVILKINYLTFEVETILTHPTKGKTHLLRKGNFTSTLMENIFRNPRTHMPCEIQGQYIK